jgi:hypothetical protein
MSILKYNGELFVNNELVNIDDYFNRNLYENAISISKELEEFKSPFINNIFLSFIHNKYLPYLRLIIDENINHINIDSIDEEALFLISASKNCNVKIDLNRLHLFFYGKKLLILSLWKLVKYYFGTIFLLIRDLFKDKSDYDKKNIPVFINSATSYKVFSQYLCNSLNKYNFFLDIFTVKTSNIKSSYTPLTVHITPVNIIIVMLYVLFNSIKEYILLYKELRNIFGNNSLYSPLSFSAERISHYFLNKFAIEKIFKKGNYKVVYSGEKESRWGLIIDDNCKRNGVRSICIPHGLHYGLKFPHSIFGDEVQCFSENEKNSLINSYSSKIVKYNRELPEKLFSYNYPKNNDEKRIVFFTEGRDFQKDETIINYLLKNFKSIYIKLHPNDNISRYNFQSKNYTILTDFVQSISNNICIARNSTVLFEALYNNSKSFSVLINPKDHYYSEYMYPTLSDDRITKVFSLEALVNQINKVKN